jgi:hypothetical protein
MNQLFIKLKTPNKNLILDLLTWVLKNNYVTFNNTFYKQVKGVAMGTNVAVAFSCIYMGQLEHQALQICSSIPTFKPPLLNLRFIDDIFGIWLSKHYCLTYINTLNSICSDIQLTYEISNSSGTFLDVTFYKGKNFFLDNFLDCKIHQKATNSYQYLPFQSYHKKSLQKSWILAEIRRYLMRTSNRKIFQSKLNSFKGRLHNRGFRDSFLAPLFDQFFTDEFTFHHMRTNCLQVHSIQKRQPQLIFKHFPNPTYSQLNLGAILCFAGTSLTWDPTFPILSNHRSNPIICSKNNYSIGKLLAKK